MSEPVQRICPSTEAGACDMVSAHSPFDAQSFLKHVTGQPGVYIFTGQDGHALYVGKAKNLKKRMQSYFRKSSPSLKTRLMVEKIHHAEVQTTRTESEALLLENNLIKSRRPRYNISLRDDKSYPYIRLEQNHEFPRLTFYRGSRSNPGKYYGPYPSAASVREMLGHLHKTFQLRQCSDAFFRNRSRPCLQYQIKRCSAPCVGCIEADEYAEDLRQSIAVLEGRDAVLIEELSERMETASRSMEYEAAAIYRDRIASLQRIRERQYISAGQEDADVVAVAVESGMACFNVVSIRRGRNLGSRLDIQSNPLDRTPSRLMEDFLPQFYLGTTIPREILIAEKMDNRASTEQVFSLESGYRVVIKQRFRTHRAKWVEAAKINAQDRLRQHLSEREQIGGQFDALASYLQLAEPPQRIECFDISHTQGERTVASCVVFDRAGPVKSAYRRFNIAGITEGDDYQAMAQAIERRYQRVLENDGQFPDLVLIDGGKGQLGVAAEVFEQLQINHLVQLLAVSKGPERRSGHEKLHLVGQGAPRVPAATSPESHLIQRIRDEAHRFAITGHRQRRSKARTSSLLEDIEGIGEKRRRDLLRYFGGIREVKRAGIEELSRVPGISPVLARRIHDRMHDV
ncbi:MAG: excinuclease ABC subunit UvrC [Gammaproteobacteria bacterium]|nr:excinuclease ABC subunit UvrC [Gammaproteobacteria bacterium]